MIADVYNTTVNFDGKTMFSSSYTPFGCCCGGGMFPMNSCFGFGFGGFGGFESGLGMGVGYAAGMALTSPQVLKGIWNGMKWVGNTVAKGVSNLWNNIFHKKSKAAKT